MCEIKKGVSEQKGENLIEREYSSHGEDRIRKESLSFQKTKRSRKIKMNDK